MQAPEWKRWFRTYDRAIIQQLRRDKAQLFDALEEFSNIRGDAQAWAHFRKRWPKFFPEHEYEKVERLFKLKRGLKLERDLKPNVSDYPGWLRDIWIGVETEPHLRILLGIESAPTDGTSEDAWLSGLATIPAKFYADWEEGVF